MADDPEKPSRPTSFAKGLDPLDPFGLKNAPGILSDLFKKYAAGELPAQQQSGQSEQPHHQPKAQPQPRPSPNLARPADSIAHRERQAREDRLAKEINDALTARRNHGRTMSPDKDHDRDRDR